LLLAAAISLAQFNKPAVSKGPRALGLVQLAPNGKAHLIPIAIMVNGEFYDATAYKAAPVPMALETQTVYEGVKTGNSVGFFTVTGALHGSNNSWVGEGTWQLPQAPAPKKPKEAAKPRVDDEEGPPRLKRPEDKKPAGSPAPQGTSSSSTTSPSPDKTAPANPPAAPAAGASTPSPAPPAQPAAPAEPPEDPNRPVLRRGKPTTVGKETPETPVAQAAAPAKPGAAKTSPAMVPATGALQIIPAVSDADGPEPRPFVYDLKPDEEQTFRKKILALAAKELLAKISGTPEPDDNRVSQRQPAPAKKPAKAASPEFKDVQLRVFDLTSNNEPVLVLTAKASLPQSKTPLTEYELTLVARADLYGDLHKSFSAITDQQHLDVLPRYELIDAVDADGDGRGELLFRKVSDSGKAFAIFRVIGNQLWPLFDGTLQ